MANPYGIDENTVKEDIDEEAADALKVEKRNYKNQSIHARANLAQQKAEAKQDTLRFATDLFQKGLNAYSAMAPAGGAAEGAGAAGLPSGVEGAAASPDLSTKSGRIGARADDLQSRAEVAGASGRLLRQAKLTDRAAALDQRVPEIQAQEKIIAQQQKELEKQRKAQFAQKVDDRSERAQKRLDRYNIRKEYGQDRNVGAYRADGDLYTAKPQAPDTSAEIFDPRYTPSDDIVRKRALTLMSQEDDLTEDEILSLMMNQ